MSYAIISLGGKQYRVSEGQRLLVDRLETEDGKTFTPDVLLVGGDGAASLSPKDVTVTVKVVGQQRGPKIRIGKYKKRTGYRRHTGFRASLTQIQIESIGAVKPARSSSKAKAGSVEKPEKTETPEVTAVPAGDLPAGYADMTIADIKAASGDWDASSIAAAIAHEQEHGKRKGALAALESALAQHGGES